MNQADRAELLERVKSILTTDWKTANEISAELESRFCFNINSDRIRRLLRKHNVAEVKKSLGYRLRDQIDPIDRAILSRRNRSLAAIAKDFNVSRQAIYGRRLKILADSAAKAINISLD